MRDEYGTNFIDLTGLVDKTMIVGGNGITTKTKSEWGDLIINHNEYECALVINSFDVIKTYPFIWDENEPGWRFSNDEVDTFIEYDVGQLSIIAEYTTQEEMTEEQKVNTTLQIIVNKK